MMQPPGPRVCIRDDDSLSLAANSTAGDSLTAMSTRSTSSHHYHYLKPILVGYAFGPKKMSTMGLIMAEASRAQLSTVVTAQVPLTPQEPTSSASHLTTAALQRAQSPKTTAPSVVLSMSRGPSGGFRNIVRYFRSSCSSVASDDTLTTATSTNPMQSTSSSLQTPTSQQRDQQQRQHVRVSFVPLDLDSPLEEQHGGNFDAILHKLTEDILCLSTLTASSDSLDDAQLHAISRVQRLEQYQRTHPYCALVDHPSNVQILMSRSDISERLSQCLVGVTSASGMPVKTPKFEIYHGHLPTTLSPPLIAKPLTAAGTKKSHCMGVVLRPQGLICIPETPCLLQEYVNHNAVLHKVYVIGNHVSVFCRPSLPNLPTNNCQEGLEYCEFDSQRPYPTLQEFGLRPSKKRNRDLKDDMVPQDDDDDDNVSVTAEEIQPVVDVLKQAFGLELFGFDVLVTFPRELLVVDVNYFPSYKEVSNFPSLLANYLTQRAIDGRIQSPVVE